jgi:long-chain acyl-CoA synthetase
LYAGKNSTAFVVSMLASLSAGAAFVPLSPDLPDPTRRAIEGLVLGSPGKHPVGWEGDDELAMVLFTSGTTARPKGVLLSENNLLSNLGMIGSRIPESLISYRDSSYAFLPWFHSYGLVCELLFLMSRGASLHIPSSTDPRTLIPEIRRLEPTLLYTVPRFMEKVQQASEQRWYLPNLLKKRLFLGSRIRLVSVGGARSHPGTLDFFRKRWGLPVFHGYGLTELSPMISLSSGEDALDSESGTSCGRLLDGVEAMDMDGRGLCVRGPSLCRGYLGENNRVVRPPDRFTEDGWFMTGDVVSFDDSARLCFDHRDSGLWKLPNGKFIDPGFIETSLLRNVEGVEQAAVFLDDEGVLTVALFMRGNKHKETRRAVGTRLSALGFQEYEIPKTIRFLEEPLSVSNGTLTIKQEPVRHAVKTRLQQGRT